MAAVCRLRLRPWHVGATSAKVVAWKDALWRHTVRGMHYTEADPERQRLSRGHRTVGQRRWDEVIQKHLVSSTQADLPWQCITEDIARVTSSELGFIDRVLRQNRAGLERRLHEGRWLHHLTNSKTVGTKNLRSLRM